MTGGPRISSLTLLIEAAVALLRARLRLSHAAATDFLSAPAPDVAGDLDADARDLVARLAWALPAAANRVPWRSDCLVRSMAAVELLRAHGVHPDIHVEAGRRTSGIFGAHVWVSAAGIPVSGMPSPELAPLRAGPSAARQVP